MKSYIRSTQILGPAVLGVLLASAPARADINGFGDFSNFTINQNDSSAAPTISIATDTIQLTPSASAKRTIFYNTPQSIVNFSASFTYQMQNYGGGGATFMLQNNPSGSAAVSGDYAFGSSGISPSALISLEDSAGHSESSFYANNGTVGSGSPSTAPVSFSSEDPIAVSLFYNGSILHEHLEDLNKPQLVFDTDIPLSLHALESDLGGATTAYVGLTAGGFNNDNSEQYFSNLQFHAVPEPASFGVMGCVAVAALLRRRRRNTQP